MTQDPAALRRRARRRLVGAVAIALTAILVVPMLFDPDPKPLGSDVDIRIPDQATPFEPAPAPDTKPQPARPEPSLQAAEPTAPAAPAETPPAVKPLPAEPTPTSPPPPPHKAVAPELPQESGKTAAKPVQEDRKAEKPQPRSDPVFASRGYYLQLGVFGSEANAKTWMAKAQAAGFKVGMTDSNGQYRVRVGPIPERDKALETQAKLKSKGFSSVIIGP